MSSAVGFASVLSLVLVADGGASPPMQLSPADIYARVSASVFRVNSGEGFGSAVVVGRDLLVTNFHVVDGIQSVELVQGELTLRGLVVATDPKRDLALIEAEGLRVAPPRRRGFGNLRVGETVFALGTPKGLEQTFSQGIVSALRPKPPPNTLPVQHTAQIARGSSGGGLFDDRGRLVGINTSYYLGIEKDSYGDTSMAVPVDWVEELLRAKRQIVDGGQRPLSPVEASTFSAVRRPINLRCSLQVRRRYAPDMAGELTQLIDESKISGEIFLLNFRSETPTVVEGKLGDADRYEVVLSAIDTEAGIAQFSGSRTKPVITVFFASDGSVLYVVSEIGRLRGSLRKDVTFGFCEGFELPVPQKKEVFDEASSGIARLGIQDRCSKRDGEACLSLAKAALSEAQEGEAAVQARKACEADVAEGCSIAMGLYERVGNVRVARDMRFRLCQLSGGSVCR